MRPRHAVYAVCAAAGLAAWLAALPAARAPVPPLPGIALPPPPVAFDPERPDLLLVGDAHFRVTIARHPQASVPDWWGWDNNGGVHRISVEGRPYLTAQGMPERWDVDDFARPADGSKLQFAQGWRGLRDAAGAGLPAEAIPASCSIRGGTVTFVQELPLRHGYACRYEKAITVDHRAYAITIAAAITNTGERPWHLRHFVHGYWNLGGGPVDGRYRLRTPLRPGATGWLAADAGGLRLRRALERPAFARDRPQPPDTANRLLLVGPGGAKVRMTGDFPPALFALYVEPAAIVPEVSVRLEIPPGDTVRWTRRFVCLPGAQAGVGPGVVSDGESE